MASLDDDLALLEWECTLAVTGVTMVVVVVRFGMGRPVRQSVFSTTSW